MASTQQKEAFGQYLKRLTERKCEARELCGPYRLRMGTFRRPLPQAMRKCRRLSRLWTLQRIPQWILQRILCCRHYRDALILLLLIATACALCVVWYGVVLWPGVNMMWSPHSYVRPTELHHGIASYSNMVLLAGTIAASSLPSCYCMSGLGTLDVLSQNRAERWQWLFSR